MEDLGYKTNSKGILTPLQLRAITGLGLKEAKEIVESAPKDLKEDVPSAEANELKEKLEAVGATIELK